MPTTVGAARSMMKGMGESASLPRPKTGGNKKANDSNLVARAKQELQMAIESQFKEENVMGGRGELMLHRMQ